MSNLWTKSPVRGEYLPIYAEYYIFGGLPIIWPLSEHTNQKSAEEPVFTGSARA